MPRVDIQIFHHKCWFAGSMLDIFRQSILIMPYICHRRKEIKKSPETAFKLHRRAKHFYKAVDRQRIYNESQLPAVIQNVETGQPFSDGDFLKNCMMETAVILCPENKVQSKSVSLSPSNLPNLLSFASILSVSAALCSNVHPDRKCHPRLSPDQNSQTTERHKHQQQYSALY